MKQFAAVLVWSSVSFCIYAQDAPADHPLDKMLSALRLADLAGDKTRGAHVFATN